jgi:transcriptional regulator with XRE-family HTH domain
MRQGLEMAKVADAAGITRSYLSRLETGKATGRVRPGTYAALRKAVNADETELLLTPTEDPSQER